MKANNKKIVEFNLKWMPRPFQREFFNGVMTHMYSLLIAARQHGKSDVAIHILISMALMDTTGSTFVYVAPFISQARRIIWVRLKRAIADIEKHCVIRESELTITMPNGSIITLAGADNEALRGTSAKLLVLDETDNMNLEILNGSILPCVASHGDNAKIVYIGTLAGGTSRLMNLLEENNKNPKWHCQIVKASEAKILTADQLEMWRTILGDHLYKREFECDPFSPSETSIMGDLIVKAERDGRIDDFPINPLIPVHFAFDLGLRDACTVWVFQLSGGFITYVAYREITDTSLENVILDLKNEFGHCRLGTVVLPHDIKVREMTTARARLSLFDDLDFGEYHHVLGNIPVTETVVATRLNMFRARFDKSGCKKGIERLRAVEYEKDGKTDTVLNKIRHNEASHGFDAFRYAMIYIENENPVMSGESFDYKKRKHKVHRMRG